MKKIVICCLGWGFCATVFAATYNMASSRPTCSGGSWSISGSVYTCSGTILLSNGDSISPSTASTVNGNISRNGGTITLSNITLNGNVSATSGGVLNVVLSNTTVVGNISDTANGLTVSGGEVHGNITGFGSGVTLTNVVLVGDVTSTTNTVTINGGTISGDISSSGGSGVVINNATVASGSISATGVPISISNSTIGSTTSQVNVSGNNTVSLSSGTTVYGSVSSGSWSSALSIDSSSFVFGVCSSNSNSVSNPSQYPYCTSSGLLAEWRMDEASWNGTAGEVKDSVGSYNGTAAYANGSGPRPSTATGSPAYTDGSLNTCRYGEFDRTSSPVRTYTYVQLGSFPSLPAQFTFAGWVRTTDRTAPNQRILVNDDNQNGWGFSFGDGGTGTLRIFNRNISNSGSVSGDGANGNCGVFCIDTDNVISNNTWYFVALTVNTSSRDVALYVFNASGNTLAHASGKYSGTWANGMGAVAIGGETAASSEGTQSSFHFKGNIDELKVYGASLSEAALKSELTRVRTCTGPIDHFRILHDGEGLTCSPETVTVQACANASCSSLYTGTSAVTLTPGGDSFTFNGGQTTTATVRQTTVGTATLNVSAASPSVTGATTCVSGTTTSCSMNFVDSGFVFDIPDHFAETSQTVTLKAVKKSDTSTVCTPAFVSQSKTIKFKCAYSNPTSGTLPVRLAGYALNAANNSSNACDTTGQDISLAFDASGSATMTALYADVGLMSVTASYTGTGSETGLTMTGADNFIAAPNDFAFTSITTSPIKAGAAFSAKVTARNALQAITPNYGKETIPETVELKTVTTSAASASNSQLVGPSGGATGALTNGNKGVFARNTCNPVSDGSVCSDTLAWTEVGDVKLVAARASGGYLGSTKVPWGVTSVLRFIPAFFETAFETAQPCGTFTYSGQPFRLAVTARSAANAELNMPVATTTNYAGSYAKDVTLGADTNTCTPTTTGFANNVLAASAFTAGVGKTPVESNLSTPSNPQPIIYSQSKAAPTSPIVCAKDTDGVTAHGTTQAHAQLNIRNGRLRLSNAFGSETQDLKMPVRTEYWSGKSWILNDADSCTAFSAANVSKTGPVAASTTPSAVALSGGTGVLTLSAPNVVGYVDLAVNLGISGSDTSCLSSHGGTPGSLPWLRSPDCAKTDAIDPSARANFGIYAPESQRIFHVRELF